MTPRQALKKWDRLEGKPAGMMNEVEWSNRQFPAWRITKQTTESCQTRFIITCTSGSAFHDRFLTFQAASKAFAVAMERYL